jgi:hypothetical protein
LPSGTRPVLRAVMSVSSHQTYPITDISTSTHSLSDMRVLNGVSLSHALRRRHQNARVFTVYLIVLSRTGFVLRCLSSLTSRNIGTHRLLFHIFLRNVGSIMDYTVLSQNMAGFINILLRNLNPKS